MAFYTSNEVDGKGLLFTAVVRSLFSKVTSPLPPQDPARNRPSVLLLAQAVAYHSVRYHTFYLSPGEPGWVRAGHVCD